MPSHDNFVSRRSGDLLLGEIIGTVKAMKESQEINRNDLLAAIIEVREDIHSIKKAAIDSSKALQEHILDDSATKAIVQSLADWRKDSNGNGAAKDIQSLKNSHIRVGGAIMCLSMIAGFFGNKIGSIKSLFS